MSSFFSNPHTHALFPDFQSVSPTAQLLASGLSAEGLMAALSAGWIAPQGVSERVGDRPALAHWVSSLPERMTNVDGHGQLDAPWPVSDQGDWGSVEPQWGGSLLRPSMNNAARVQWLAGALVALAPEGLGRVCWKENEHARSNSSLLGLAVERGWLAVVDQLLRRPDAPSPGEVEAMRCSWYRGGWKLSSSPPFRPERNNLFSPLLHWALKSGDVGVARRLLDHGVSPFCLDDSGLPAWMCSKTTAALECVLGYMKTPAQAMSPPCSPSDFWASAQGSVAAAQPLLDAFNAWLKEAIPDSRRNQAVLSAAAVSLPTSSLSALKAQLASAQVNPTDAWEENGMRWTLATASLAWSACSGADSEPTRGWALTRGRLEKEAPVFEGVPNLDALWWLSADWVRARQLWEARGGTTPPTSLEATRRWVNALTQCALCPSSLWMNRALGFENQSILLKNAWKAIGQLSPQDLVAEEVHQMRDQVLSATIEIQDWSAARGLVVWCFDNALAESDKGNAALASKWARWGLRLWVSTPPSHLFGSQDQHSVARALQSALAGGPAPSSSETLSQLRICRQFQQVLEKDIHWEDSRPSATSITAWEAHAGSALFMPFVRAALMSASLQAPAPSSLRVRM